MLIYDAAKHFDKDPAYDGYTGTLLFLAQTSAYDSVHSDGSTFRRRILGLAPGIALPARNVLTLYGDRWVVGTGTPDGFLGNPIRQHFVMKKATDLMALLTPGQVLASSPGVSCYVNKTYFKDIVSPLTDSGSDPSWDIFASPSEPVVSGMFFRDQGNKFYRVRQTYLPAEGLTVCQSDSLEAGPLTNGVFDTGSYDPVSDAYAGGTLTVPVLVIPQPVFYRFRYISDPAHERGDIAVFAPTTLTPKRNDKFVMNGMRYVVVQVQAELDAWALQVRLA